MIYTNLLIFTLYEKEEKSLIKKDRKETKGETSIMKRDLYGAINWTKVMTLAKGIVDFIEKNNKGYNVLEILMAFEMVKYCASDLPKIERGSN